MQKIIVLVLLSFFSSVAISQVIRYYDRGEKWGYDDNSYKAGLIHSINAQDCSCLGLFNLINENDSIAVDSCLSTGLETDCELKLVYKFWNKGKHLGRWSTDIYLINPYQFAVLMNRTSIVKSFHENGTELDQDSYCCVDYEGYVTNYGPSGKKMSILRG